MSAARFAPADGGAPIEGTPAGTDGAPRRIWLDAASWVDVVPRWFPAAAAVYDRLTAGAGWRPGRVWRYERWMEEPRLTAALTSGLAPELVEARRRLAGAYGVTFDQGALSWYRDGRDSVGFHRDREMRWLEDTVVAILTLGGPRPFQFKPLGQYEDLPTLELAPADGDLLVLGGRCQADWLHAVPKVAALAVPGRISVQWRWTSRRGRPDQSPSWRAPRTFGS